MATPPTFSSGAVLTAAQMNSVGLWLVKSQTVGSAVSSVTVSSAFSADYDSYRIIFSGGSGSSGSDLRMNLVGSTAGYYSSINWVSYAGAAGTTAGNGIAYWWAGSTRAEGNSICMDVHRPFAGDETWFNGNYVGVTAGSVQGVIGGYHNLGLSYTAFTITPTAGTLTGGTITVYGYRSS
jgi:hypothetical protein